MYSELGGFESNKEFSVAEAPTGVSADHFHQHLANPFIAKTQVSPIYEHH